MFRLDVCLLVCVMLWSSVSASITIVDVRSNSTVVKAAALACAGITNRNGAEVFVLAQSQDPTWLEITEGLPPTPTTTTNDFLRSCMSSHGVMVYNLTGQQTLFPVLMTVGAVLDAIPVDEPTLDVLFPSSAGRPRVVLDAVTEYGMGRTSAAALAVSTAVWDKFGQNTTSLAMMDPGYDESHPVNPPLSGLPNPGLIDFIFQRRLFNFFLSDACIPLTKDYALMSRIASENPWPKPIKTYGYNSAWNLGGDIFEAETDCVKEHNMGEIASDGCSNLSFFSSKPAVTTPRTQPPVPDVAFNASRTYINLIVGDGDNLNYLKGSRLDWFQQRLAKCNGSSPACYPLSWSMSPQTLTVAPQWLQHYYDMAATTSADWFVMPPSGFLYSYPATMPADVQAAYVRDTNTAAHLMNTSVTVTWEWFDNWGKSIDTYLPQYSGSDGQVKGFVAVDVPFMFPVLRFGADEFYKVLGANEDVVLFRPREWRGTTGKTNLPFAKSFYLTTTEMAAEVNGYAPGTVTSIYLTSDGGANLSAFDELVTKLHPHVQVVDPTTVVRMAVEAHKAKST